MLLRCLMYIVFNNGEKDNEKGIDHIGAFPTSKFNGSQKIRLYVQIYGRKWI